MERLWHYPPFSTSNLPCPWLLPNSTMLQKSAENAPGLTQLPKAVELEEYNLAMFLLAKLGFAFCPEIIPQLLLPPDWKHHEQRS
jgi:hypothetical protein